MILSIDPGLEYFAVATWDKNGWLELANFYETQWNPGGPPGKAMRTAAMFDGIFERELRNECERVVIECPVIYPKSKAPPQDIMHLYGAVIAIAQVCNQYFVRVDFVEPRAWKGNVPKEIFGKRIVSKLLPKELKAAQLDKFPKTKRHDVVDAIGIGLWSSGRLK
jgi:hypothetical protein